MTILESATTFIMPQPPPGPSLDEEQLAAASFRARYSGRTLDAYRDDLRGFFQWAHDHGVEVMKATRPHIELFALAKPIGEPGFIHVSCCDGDHRAHAVVHVGWIGCPSAAVEIGEHREARQR